MRAWGHAMLAWPHSPYLERGGITGARANDGTVVEVVADALDGGVAPLPSASR